MYNVRRILVYRKKSFVYISASKMRILNEKIHIKRVIKYEDN